MKKEQTTTQTPKTEAHNNTQTAPKTNANTQKGTKDMKNAQKSTAKKSTAKKNPATNEKGFKAFIDENGIGHFAIPSIKADTVNGAKVYAYSAHAKTSELCRNSVKSAALAQDVQLAIVRRELDRVAVISAKLTKKLEDENIMPIERDRLKAEQESLTAAKADMVKRFPGCVKFSYDNAPHATLCAAGVLEKALPLSLDSFNSAMLAAAAVCRAALETKSNGEGAKAFTPEEREKLCAVKDEVTALFSKFCIASEVNKQFALRVKDSDIFTWYEMHKVLRGERKKYAEELADMGKALTMWFLGKIYKDTDQTTPKQETKKQ